MNARRVTRNMPQTGHVTASTCRTGLALVMLVGSVGALCPSTRGADVRVTKIDGAVVTGSWIGSANGRTLELSLNDGPVTLRIDDVATVEFSIGAGRRPLVQDKPGDPSAEMVPATFHLADGGRLYGQLIEPKEASDSVMGITRLGRPTELPFDRLGGVEFADRARSPLAREAFVLSLVSRRPGKDILITRERPAFAGSDDDPQTQPPRAAQPEKNVAGRLISIGPRTGSFVFSDRRRSFQTPRIYGIVLAAGVWSPTTPAARREYPATFELIDGSIFSGRIEQADMETIRIATTLNSSVALDLSAIAAIRITSERVVYAEDLKLTAQKTTGILHRPWPPRFGENAAGGPIVLGGKTFERGLGVHSRTEIGLALDGVFDTFVATIGIDDSVRPRGSVVFRVTGDGRDLYDSGTVTGKHDPIDIRVDVSNVQEVRLIVDFGDGLDLADHADWANARFLKPAPPVDAKAQ